MLTMLVVTPDNHNSLLWCIRISFCKCGLLSKLLERVLGSIALNNRRKWDC
jgi:hypothetical protein